MACFARVSYILSICTHDIDYYMCTSQCGHVLENSICTSTIPMFSNCRIKLIHKETGREDQEKNWEEHSSL